MTKEGDKEGRRRKSHVSSVDSKEIKASVTKEFCEPPLLIEPPEPEMHQEEPTLAYQILTRLLLHVEEILLT